jgi:hypothetical protein
MTQTTHVRDTPTPATASACTTVFAEHSLRLRADASPDGTTNVQRSTVRGMSIEHTDGNGWSQHRFADNDALLRAGRTETAADAADTLRDVQERPLYALSEQSENSLAALAAETGADLTLGVVQQHIAAGAPDRVRATERMVTTLEVRLTGQDGTRHTRSVLCDSPHDTTTLREAAAHTAEQIRGHLALPLADTLPQKADLVLLPGLAGAFFHEIVGHPMEADVVASATSYLGARTAQPVAPAWLSVLDGGQETLRGYHSPFDDQGTDCSTARLIDRGTVGRPMTDLALAGRLRTPATGHGRRQDYRHPAIPRMTHTAALVEPGTPVQAPPGDWITPYGLRLHMMNIASGEFVFDAPFSLLHRADGRLARLGPLEVTGHGAHVLAGIEPFEHRVEGYLRATGGCGKLGQYPVLVSFANAGLRLPSGLIGLRAVARA